MAPPSEDEIARRAIVALVGERSVWSFERVERHVAERIGQSTRRSAQAQQRAIERTRAQGGRKLLRRPRRHETTTLTPRDACDREPALERYTTQPLIEVEQEVVRWLNEAAAQGRPGGERDAHALRPPRA